MMGKIDKNTMMQIQMLRTQINNLESSKAQLDQQYSIIWLIIGGFFILIPWFFIPGRLSAKSRATSRVDQQIRDIENQIQMLQFQVED